VLAILVIGAVVGAFFIGRTNAPPSPVGPGAKIPITFSAFYLDIGASASLGFQPTGIKGHNGHSTNDGYADDLALMERFKGTSLSVDKTGCPGETLRSFLATATTKHCNNLRRTQMSKDVAYLHAHQGEPGLITIDIGFNNIRECLTYATVNESCVNEAVSAAKVDTPKIVKDLRDASGANVQIVGLEYNDPFLGHYLNGPTGPADAQATLVAMNRMNAALKGAYVSAGALVADVPAFFQMDNSSPVTITNVGTMPENVKEACDLTWLCYSSPFGPDDHPNDAGYALIAKAILAVLPKTW
jgi:lysophospholipase L1-like esterase